MMKPELILLPVFTLILLTFGIMFWMARLRFKAVGEKAVPPRYFKTFEGNVAMPEQLSKVTRNFHNLMEIPVLFYVVIAFILILGKVDAVYIYLAWAYTVTRFIHSIVHVSYNYVIHRLFVFFISCLLLMIIWARLFLQTAT